MSEHEEEKRTRWNRADQAVGAWSRRQIIEWNKHLRRLGLPSMPVPPISLRRDP